MRVTLFLVPGPWESLMPFNKRVFSVSFQYTHVVLRLIWSFYYLQSKCIYKQNGHFNSISDNKEYGMDEGDIFAERLSRSSWVNINIKREAESSSELFVLCLWSISSVLKQFFLHNFSSFTLIFLWRRFSDLFILPYLKFHHKWLFKFFLSLCLFLISFKKFCFFPYISWDVTCSISICQMVTLDILSCILIKVQINLCLNPPHEQRTLQHFNFSHTCTFEF